VSNLCSKLFDSSHIIRVPVSLVSRIISLTIFSAAEGRVPSKKYHRLDTRNIILKISKTHIFTFPSCKSPLAATTKRSLRGGEKPAHKFIDFIFILFPRRKRVFVSSKEQQLDFSQDGEYKFMRRSNSFFASNNKRKDKYPDHQPNFHQTMDRFYPNVPHICY